MTIARFVSACSLLLALASSAQRVDNAEYFWDTDPGPGNAIPMSATDGAFDEALEAIFAQTNTLPQLGTHTLGIRVKDQAQNWGPTFTTMVVIEPSVVTAPDITVTQAEYFWDIDPGEGNGAPMIAFDGDFNSALEAIAMVTTALPADGVHVLHIRVKEVNDAWSVPFRVVVEVLGGVVTFPEIRVSAAEYYVNDDPGFGQGTPMFAVDGDLSGALEAIMGGGIPAPVTAGVNVLWLRARDVNGAWGPAFGVVVNIDTTITGINGLEEHNATNTVRIAPNPTSAEFGCAILLEHPVDRLPVRVIDATGRLIFERTYTSTRQLVVPLQGAAPGVYQVGVHLNGVSHWERLVVN
jgi:hypothetical protein